MLIAGIMKQVIKQSSLRWITLWFLVVTSCTKPLSIGNTSASYELTRFRSKTKQANPCVFGMINRHDPLAGKGGIEYVVIKSDDRQTSPDATGKYCRTFQPGKHTISFTQIGYLYIMVKDIHLRTGDSIRLDVHLQGDTTSLY